MKSIEEMEEELLLKEKRVAYWEKFHAVPTMSELINSNSEVII
jgi:hypothetical protein